MIGERLARLFEVGGPLMWPLLACSLLLWFLLAFRACQLRWQVFLAPEELLALAAWQSGSASGGRLPHLPRGAQALLLAGLHPEPGTAPEAALAAACKRAETLLLAPRYVTSALVAIAPLLGLLGTIHGLVGTFSVISLAGTSEPAQLARGISQALVTTEFGLLIAVPGLIVEQRLLRWEERLRHRLEVSYLALLQLRHASEEAGNVGAGTSPRPEFSEAKPCGVS